MKLIDVVRVRSPSPSETHPLLSQDLRALRYHSLQSHVQFLYLHVVLLEMFEQVWFHLQLLEKGENPGEAVLSREGRRISGRLQEAREEDDG